MAPFFALYLCRNQLLVNRARGKSLTIRIGLLISAVLIITVPTLIVFREGFSRAISKATHHPFFSGNALNLCWIGTYALHVVNPAKFQPLGANIGVILTYELKYTLLPRLVAAAALVLLILSQWRRPNTWYSVMAHASCAVLAYCTFSTGVHENHWIYAVFPLGTMACYYRGIRRYFLFWGAAAAYNLFIFYGITGRASQGSERLLGFHASVATAALYTAAFFFSLRMLAPAHAPGQNLKAHSPST
jgi:hypothetical protein